MRGGNVGQTVASGSGQGGGTAASGNHVVRGIVFAALGGICWGFSGTCAQLMTSGFGVPVSWITCVRLLLAAVIFLVVCGVREPRNLLAALRDVRSLGRIAAFALLGVLLTQVSYLSAISYTNAGTGTVLERLGLIVIMVYVCLRMRRLPRIREAAGLVLASAAPSSSPRRATSVRWPFLRKACSGASSRRSRWRSTRCFPARCWRSGAASS